MVPIGINHSHFSDVLLYVLSEFTSGYSPQTSVLIIRGCYKKNSPPQTSVPFKEEQHDVWTLGSLKQTGIHSSHSKVEII